MKRTDRAVLSVSWDFSWTDPLVIGFIVFVGPVIVTLILAALS